MLTPHNGAPRALRNPQRTPPRMDVSRRCQSPTNCQTDRNRCHPSVSQRSSFVRFVQIVGPSRPSFIHPGTRAEVGRERVAGIHSEDWRCGGHLRLDLPHLCHHRCDIWHIRPRHFLNAAKCTRPTNGTDECVVLCCVGGGGHLSHPRRQRWGISHCLCSSADLVAWRRVPSSTDHMSSILPLVTLFHFVSRRATHHARLFATHA